MATKPTKNNPIGDLVNIIDLFNGKTQTTTTSPETSTETTRSNQTQEQLNNQISMAMAPLNMASKGVGLSTYGDTTLALGRGQIAGDILARNAGTTRTSQSSGRTSTTKSPGAFGGDNTESLLTTLAVAQLGLPAVKKLYTKSGLGDWIDNSTESITDFITTPSSWFDFGSSAGDLASEVTTNAIANPDIITSMLPDLISTESIVSNVADSVDLGNFAFDSYFGFADGGMIRKPGYADGGYIDRPLRNSRLTPNIEGDNVLTASGSYIPYVPIAGPTSTPMAGTGGGGGGGRMSQVDSGDSGGGRRGTVNMSRVVGNMMGNMNPYGRAYNAVSNLTGMMPSTGDLVSNIMDRISPNQMMNPAQQQIAADYKASMGGGGGRDAGDGLGNPGDSFGGVQAPGEVGRGTNYNMGGDISGPGTGTSDSITIKASNGERMITAKTNEEIEKRFPGFFHMLEQQFNPQAAMAQAAKGRA